MSTIDQVKKLLLAKDSNVQSRRTTALSRLAALGADTAQALVESQEALEKSNCHGGERPGYRCPRCAALRLDGLAKAMKR